MKDICKTMDPVSNKKRMTPLLLCDAGNGNASAIQRTLQLKQELTDLLTVAGDIENCVPILAIVLAHENDRGGEDFMNFQAGSMTAVPAREIDSKMDRARMGADIGGDM